MPQASSWSASRQVVTAPCPYKLNTNWASVNHDIPTWLANVLGGKGKIIVDRGLPGSPISEASNKEIEQVLGQFPGIEIVGWYTSNYELGAEQAGVASLLAANPQIDGILTAGYGTGAIQALKDAGPAARADRHVRLQRLGIRMRDREPAGARNASSTRTRHISRPKPSSSRSTCSTASRRPLRKSSNDYPAADHRHRRG